MSSEAFDSSKVLKTWTVVRMRQIEDTVVVEAATAEDAYQEAVGEFFAGPNREPSASVETSDYSLWVDVYGGDRNEMSNESEYHVDL